MKFSYEWKLADGYPAKGIKPHGCKVFGTFICGGGSTMGYKLAGYHHLGGVEIDERIANVYRQNHHPEHFYLEDLRKFNERDDLPDELYQLDLLDGSPPCSSFSTCGKREKDWGKNKKFTEGQALQRLDDLVFVYVETIKKLQPKVALLENVTGLVKGNARTYSRKIIASLKNAGYEVQVFLLNGATMGLPQKRERVFFIARQRQLKLPPLHLSFSEKPITFGELNPVPGKPFTIGTEYEKYWHHLQPTDRNIAQIKQRFGEKPSSFGGVYFHNHYVPNTIVANSTPMMASCRHFVSTDDLCKIGSYPQDYDFGEVEPVYLIGMSVPPLMTASIAHQLYRQWFSKMKPAKAGKKATGKRRGP